ncbi:MAG: hypothetical protein HWE26_20090 [Alteromonadaceae bacterium]|nr:hypothetical protein [Alteromonadaceae bacterium]
MIIEKGASDEIFVLQDFGIQIDIAGLIDHINSNEDQYQVCECATSRLLEVNRADGINREVLANMSDSRSNQPILVTAIDEYEWVIDGNHRLIKRAELAKAVASYIPINGVQLDPYVSEFSWRI